jgi:nicotinate-nucleotide adenylyltransferase
VARRRLGVFGGTFDPPHVGHLALAEWARERLGLDRVLFVVAGQPPHKSRDGLSSSAARLAMTRLAVRGHPAFEVSTIELESAGPSYTVDTLRRLSRRHPESRLYLLMGADNLDELPTWREPAEIRRLASVAVAARPGADARARHLRGGKRSAVMLDNPVLDVSSTMVRARARAGRSVRYLVPDAVARYIDRHHLYRRRRKAS